MAANRYAAAARKARQLTNKQLATEISALAPISRDKLQEMLPRKRDKETFLALMKVVESETDMDKKIGYLRDNLDTAGKVIIQGLKLFL